VEKGFNKAMMDDVAVECGVSKGTLYLYFSSKNALIGAICAYELNLYLQVVNQAATMNVLKTILDEGISGGCFRQFDSDITNHPGRADSGIL
jgi:AcrR family transcriptional regulator